MPSEHEEAYFARKDFERRQKIEEEKAKRLQAEERTKLKDLHFMRCPKCGMQLIEIDYKSIKIDQCSHCGGMWLDHNELETILSLEATNKSAFDSFLRIFTK